MNMKLNTAFGAALVVAFALCAPVFAQPPSEVAKTVRYSDLDLSTPAGVRTLYGRIQDAAWQVCHELVPAENGPSGIENAKCRHTLVDDAVDEMNKAALTALHTGRSPENRTAER
jgi:UrcA family protein